MNLSEIGLAVLAAAQERDPEWQEPDPDAPVRSLVVQGEEDGELLAVGASVGDGPRYWCKLQGDGRDQTWKQFERGGHSVWTLWSEHGWHEIADAPPFAPERN